MKPVPELTFPLYAIVGPDRGFACISGKSPRDNTTIGAVVICTHRAIARAYIVDRLPDGKLVTIHDAMNFRGLLGDLPPPVFGVSIDPDVIGNRIATRWFGEIDDVLALLTEPTFA